MLSVWEPSRCAHCSGQQWWDPASASIHRAAGQSYLVWRKHPKEGREQGCQQESRPISGHPWEALVAHSTPRMVPRSPEAAWSHLTVEAW